MFRRDSRWTRLSRPQKRVFQGELGYFALLLYRYTDQHGTRRQLEPFAWQLARDATVEQLSDWLKHDDFRDLQNSQQIIRALSDDRIGTDRESLIANDIAPPVLPSLVITIRWKDGKGPGDSVRVQERSAIDGSRESAALKQ